MMGLILEQAAAGDYKRIKKLYKSAFPPEERPPFFMLRTRAESGKGQMLVAKDEGAFIGFAYLVCYLDMAYLFLLAVDGGKRGKGYGSKILGKLREKYRGKRLFLAREQLDRTAENYGQRVKRHEFYLKNGFSDLPCRIKEAGVVYDTMSTGETISAAEYQALISGWMGKLAGRLTDMRLIE